MYIKIFKQYVVIKNFWKTYFQKTPGQKVLSKNAGLVRDAQVNFAKISFFGGKQLKTRKSESCYGKQPRRTPKIQ